jgi:hypothetical protein
MMSRFVVVETHGFLTPIEGRTGYVAGLSATVIDDLTGRELATYRSEDERVHVSGGRLNVARRKAREHAARLEAEYGG